MRGRKPKATVLKLLAGKPGHRRLPSDEPQPAGKLYVPPAWMNDQQKEEWRYGLDNAPLGLLRLLDRNIFAQWCVASVDAVMAELAIQAEGPVVFRGGDQRTTTNPDGLKVETNRSPSKVLNPWVRARRDAFDRMMKAETSLGFSPTSRSRITLAGGGKKETNRFANNAASKRA